jgi:hypothetical protein
VGAAVLGLLANDVLQFGDEIDDQETPALAQQFPWPQRPGTIEVGLEPMFVREAIDALNGGML